MPARKIKDRALRVQERLARFAWLEPIPDHFLHVWFGGPVTVGETAHAWGHAGPFEIEYRRINCFHSAVVVEAHAAHLHRMIEGTQLDPRTFLPHMTIAVTREAHEPEELRSVLLPLRDERLGVATAREAKRVRFPAAQTTLLQPWEVVETVGF